MSGTITAQQYTEKSYVIRGDVWPHADLLSKFGKYCHNLKSGGPGWVVSIKKFKGLEESVIRQGIPCVVLPPSFTPSSPSPYSSSPSPYPSPFPPSPSPLSPSPSPHPTLTLVSSSYIPLPTHQPHYVGTPMSTPIPVVPPPKYCIADVEAMSDFELVYYLVNNSVGEVLIKGDEPLDTLRCLVLVEMANHRGNVEPGLRNLIKIATFNKISTMSNLQVAIRLKGLGIKYVGLTFSRLVALIVIAAYEEGSGGISSRYRELLVSLDNRLKDVLPSGDYEGESEDKKVEVVSPPLLSSLPSPGLPVG